MTIVEYEDNTVIFALFSYMLSYILGGPAVLRHHFRNFPPYKVTGFATNTPCSNKEGDFAGKNLIDDVGYLGNH